MPEETDSAVDPLGNLEERITRAVETIGTLRNENESLRKRAEHAESNLTDLRTKSDESHQLAEEFQKEAAALEERVRGLTVELETLRTERKQVKSRIEKLLSQLDLISAG